MIHSPLISQSLYLDYKHAIDDISLVYKCNKKGQLDQLVDDPDRKRLQKQKHLINHTATMSYKEGQQSEPIENVLRLRYRIEVINAVHAKLHACQKEQTLGEYLLAADLYHTSLKVMNAWNHLCQAHPFSSSKDLLIHSPISPESTALQPLSITMQPLTEAEKARNRYWELLAQYPQIRRTGENNDYTKGTYEILYDSKDIDEVADHTYEALYRKTHSHEIALKGSIIGVVYEDPWAVIIRDAVISPHGKRHTYIRFFWKSHLNASEAGAAILPIVNTPEGAKISLILTHRHATSWEFEIPRGGSWPNETSEQAAKRELKEETGYLIDKPIYLGKIAPDTGILSSVISIYWANVIGQGEAKQEKTEAIKGVFLFSFEEIKQALLNKDQNGNSYLEVKIEEEKKRFPIRDPFFVYALFQYLLLSEAF